MRADKTKPPENPDWSKLLADAVSVPGVIHQAYQRFWNYSVGNQLLAWWQCTLRCIELGPINTFVGWKECGRSVKKGEKAIVLCMPVTCKRRQKEASGVITGGDDNDDNVTDGRAETFTRFVYKRHWFVLSQTEGQPYIPAKLPDWDEDRALTSLAIQRVTFDHPNGNCQGFANRRTVAVSPIAFAPHRTLFHELGHIVLGHTEEYGMLDDHECTPKCLREVEAECVALICCASLGLDGSEHSRGYIQHWLCGQAIAEKSVQKIFKAADAILKAGYQQEA